MNGDDQKPSSLNSPLIQISGEDGYGHGRERNNENGIQRKEVVEEVKKQVWLAGPLICISLLQFCLQLISVMFVGHLGELALSGASMATSFASVTGFSMLVGFLVMSLWSLIAALILEHVLWEILV